HGASAIQIFSNLAIRGGRRSMGQNENIRRGKRNTERVPDFFGLGGLERTIKSMHRENIVVLHQASAQSQTSQTLEPFVSKQSQVFAAHEDAAKPTIVCTERFRQAEHRGANSRLVQVKLFESLTNGAHI